MPPRRYQQRRGPRPQRRRGPQGGAAVADAPAAPRPTGPIELPSAITVKDLADELRVSHADVIKELIRNGIFATINQTVDFDTASLVAAELGFETVERGAAEREAEAEHKEIVAPGAAAEAARRAIFAEEEGAVLVTRAPVVTIMGHVDHGKTSLLDAIRSTSVAAGERGGITQHIGASEVVHNGRRIVFLDTPGHEAFTAMRARGAQVTDIAVIVVAADDGVMPQTREAIDHVRAAQVPMIVAINKIDKPDANPDRVKQELADIGVLIEEYGGDVIAVPVSAKQKVGLDDLMEMILLVADLQDLKANPDRPAVGTIIESKVEKGRGNVATVLVQTGTLKTGDIVTVGGTYGRVRALQNAAGKRVKQAEPATAVEVIGLTDLPEAGDILRVVPDEKTARDMAEEVRRQAGAEGRGAYTLEDMSAQIQAAEVKELRVVLKTDVQGSLGAIRGALERLNTPEARISILREGAGDINESDVLLASASDAVVIGFNTRVDPGAQRVIDSTGVDVRIYDVIYKLTDEVGQALQGMLAPKLIEQVEGHAEVRMVIRAGRAGNVAGSYVTDGRIVRGAQARLFRGGKQVAEARIESLRRFKDDVREVAAGFECGIGLSIDDIAEGDVIECYQMVSEQA
ncbi:MAG TPA: translation initiation factor IF-2 [candidate division Zixibacteria bacterium]|nr:translation initiation factor IF-2 [candidate division Zixibacteria bacterium]